MSLSFCSPFLPPCSVLFTHSISLLLLPISLLLTILFFLSLVITQLYLVFVYLSLYLFFSCMSILSKFNFSFLFSILFFSFKIFSSNSLFCPPLYLFSFSVHLSTLFILLFPRDGAVREETRNHPALPEAFLLCLRLVGYFD